MAHDPNLFYPKPQSEPTHTAGPSFVTWSLLGKPFPSNKERITSKYTILCMPGSAQGTPLLGMPTGVGTKFQGHFHHIPLSLNHPLTTDDIGPPIALTMAVIMISPLIWGYKYGGLEKGKGCWEVPRVINRKEKGRERGREQSQRVNQRDKKGSLIKSLCREQLKVGNLKPTLQISSELNWG